MFKLQIASGRDDPRRNRTVEIVGRQRAARDQVVKRLDGRQRAFVERRRRDHEFAQAEHPILQKKKTEQTNNKQNKTKTKQNKTKNKTKQKTKQLLIKGNTTKQNKNCVPELCPSVDSRW